MQNPPNATWIYGMPSNGLFSKWPSYGRLRITSELRHRGWVVNAKRVHRIMREDNLLCLRRRKFPESTDY